MRILRYNHNDQPRTAGRMGALFGHGDQTLAGDLRAGFARYLVDERKDSQGRDIARLRFPTAGLAPFYAIGPAATDALNAAHDYLAKLADSDPEAKGLDGEALFHPLSDCRIHAPCRPVKVIAAGRNYKEHLGEMGTNLPHKIPSSWIKSTSSVMGPTRGIVKPAASEKLDYETELAIVVGKKCKNVPEEKAYDVIAGYMVGNDVTARDVVALERAEGNQMLGKMFDTFCPIGPWMVTKDEVSDPMNLSLTTRVNGEVRQESTTAMMVWPIPKLIAWFSQMTLEPGDIILTGTPSGVAAGRDRRDGKTDWYLNVGDLLESEIGEVGTLRNPIIDEPEPNTSWDWATTRGTA